MSVELDSIFKLRFYRKQEKWVLNRTRKDGGKEKEEQPRKRYVSCLNETYTVDEASTTLNEAFLETGPKSPGPDPAYPHSMDAAYPAAREYDSSVEEFMLGAQEAAHSSEIELSDGEAPQKNRQRRRAPRPTLDEPDGFLDGFSRQVVLFENKMILGRGRGRLLRGGGSWS